MSTLLQRLKQRKLVQWALAYLAGAWVALEVVDVLGSIWALPEVIAQAATVLLVAGFFAVLVLAWYHGERGRQKVSGAELILIALVLAIGGSLVTVLGEEGVSSDPLHDDVLPLVVMMDSHHPRRVYDEETVAAGGTNADVVSDILLDLPIRRQKEAVGPDWHRDEEILGFHPDLIIIHYSAFRQEDDAGPRLRLRLLVEFFADSDTRFIFYGRWDEAELRGVVDDLLAELYREYPDMLGRVTVFGLLDYGEPRWRDPQTAASLKLLVKKTLALD